MPVQHTGVIFRQTLRHVQRPAIGSLVESPAPSPFVGISKHHWSRYTFSSGNELYGLKISVMLGVPLVAMENTAPCCRCAVKIPATLGSSSMNTSLFTNVLPASGWRVW